MHVEPVVDGTALRERAHAAALTVPRVREIHNLSLVTLDGATELSLHLKLPGELPLEEAHDIAEQVERAIVLAVPEIASVQTHLEPLSEPSRGGAGRGRLEAAVVRAAGGPPRELRVLRTATVSSRSSRSGSTRRPRSRTRTRARARWRSASAASRPDVADVIVHTEP